MAQVERVSLYLSPEAKAILRAEVTRRKHTDEKVSQTQVIQELIMTHLPAVHPRGETPCDGGGERRIDTTLASIRSAIAQPSSQRRE